MTNTTAGGSQGFVRSEEACLEEIGDLLSRMPDLAQELRKAPLELKRQVFEAFDLQVVYDKLEKRI